MPDLAFYLGTYTSGNACGIYHVLVPDARPQASVTRLVAEARNPSWLTAMPGQELLLAVEELEASEGAQLTAFTTSGGNLVRMGSTTLPASNACHIGIHPTRPLAVTAHYGDGSAALWRVRSDGPPELLQQLQFFGHGPNARRQQGSHIHFAAFLEAGQCVVLTDLGDDAVHFLQLTDADTPSLIERQRLDLPAGSGPRHLAVGTQRLYLACELHEMVYVIEKRNDAYVIHSKTAPFDAPCQADGALSAIRLSPDGRFAYVAGRNQNAIAWMAVDVGDGGMLPCGHLDCGGQKPRDITIDPSGRYLLVANQGSDEICLFELDPHSGMPRAIPGKVNVSSPACIVCMPYRPALFV